MDYERIMLSSGRYHVFFGKLEKGNVFTGSTAATHANTANNLVVCRR
jgi:hypothetical protein